MLEGQVNVLVQSSEHSKKAPKACPKCGTAETWKKTEKGGILAEYNCSLCGYYLIEIQERRRHKGK